MMRNPVPPVPPAGRHPTVPGLAERPEPDMAGPDEQVPESTDEQGGRPGIHETPRKREPRGKHDPG